MRKDAVVKEIKMIRADLSPIFENTGAGVDSESIEDWEGAVMFEAPHDVNFDSLEALADMTVNLWADVTEWSVEIICPGLYRLTPREWTTKPVAKTPECRHGDGKCFC